MCHSPHDMALQSPFDSEPLKRKLATRGRRAPRALSIVEWFFLLPWQGFGAGSAVPDVCLFVLAATQASPAALPGGAQHENKRATIPDWPAAVGTAVPS